MGRPLCGRPFFEGTAADITSAKRPWSAFSAQNAAVIAFFAYLCTHYAHNADLE